MSYYESIEEYHDAIKDGKLAVVLDVLDNMMPFDSPDGKLQVAYLDKKRDIATKWQSWIDHPHHGNPMLNNRLIGIPEVVYDFDPMENESTESFNFRLQHQLETMSKERVNIVGVFKTGSRGIHIHAIHPEVVEWPRDRIHKWKQYCINRYGSDPAKATLRSMIAIEGAPHWKTGNRKEAILNAYY
jgi:hypothetical protein